MVVKDVVRHLSNLVESDGGGAAFLDYDQDGYIDIASADEARFVIIPKFNRGDGTFTTDIELPEGETDIIVRAVDDAGNAGVASQTVTVDTTLPTILSVVPSAGATGIPPEALGRVWRGRIFLLSGDALAAPASRLLELLEYLRERFGEHLERVSAYGSARALRDKSLEDLRRMRELGLRLVYFGLESGDDQTLRLARKGASAAQQLEAALRAQEAGMELSVMVLLGLGGRSLSRQHAKGTARLLNRIQPRYLAALTLMLEPHCEYYEMWQRGEFQPLSHPEVLQELLWLVEDLELRDTLFRTNHASNYLPLGGHLPRDRRRILEVLRAALAGHLSLRPEFLRAL